MNMITLVHESNIDTAELAEQAVTRVAGTPFMASTSQAPGATRKAPLYCTGCGSDISNQATDQSCGPDTIGGHP